MARGPHGDPTRRTVHHDGVHLAVFEWGDPDAATVLLVHGWPDSHHLWHGVADRLVEGFHVVAYDARGVGGSTDPGTVEAFRVDRLAGDLRAVADAVSPGRPVHLVGHDWGSTTGWEAVCEPWAESRVATFTSVSGPSLDHVGLWSRGALRDPGRVRDVLAQTASSAYMPLFASPLAPPVLRRLVTRDRWRAYVRRVEGFDPPEWGHGPTLAEDLVGGLRIYRANLGAAFGARPRERRTTVPVLQLVATRDVAVRPATLEAARPWTAHLERVELPYGHWVVLSRPDLVAEHVARFARPVAG